MIELLAKRIAKDESGFNMVELIVAVVILFVMLAGVLFFFDFGFSNFKLAQSKGVLSQEADAALEKMVRQIRVASSFNVAAPSGWKSSTSGISFSGDIRGDGTTSDVTFYQSTDNQLMRTDSKATAAALANRVTNLQFEFYDLNGTSLGTSVTSGNRTSIKLIKVTLDMQRQVTGQNPITTEKVGTVDVRIDLT